MTEMLYQLDSYLRTFDGTVTAIDAENRAVILDRTAFYPGGGGQPADRGKLTLNDRIYPVERAKKAGEDVLHFLGGDDPLPAVGDRVSGEIDWERRYQLMRTHTALHILCGRLSGLRCIGDRR